MTSPALEDVWVPLRRRLSRIKAQNRAVDRRLRDLDYRPRPVEEPTQPNDVIICGSPRSGTTLLAAQLFQPPHLISVTEPWDGLRRPPAEVFAAVRDQLAGGRLRSRLDIEALRTQGEVDWGDDAADVAMDPVADDAVVVIKWPTWWHYLDRLPDTRFLVTLRHPAEVIDSYARSGGHLREGRDYPVAMNRELNREVARRGGRSLAVRRAALYEVINRALLPHLDRPNVLAVRYERWFDDPEGLRAELSSFLGRALGPLPAEIRRPQSAPVGAGLVGLVRTHVPVAADLGYDT